MNDSEACSFNRGKVAVSLEIADLPGVCDQLRITQTIEAGGRTITQTLTFDSSEQVTLTNNSPGADSVQASEVYLTNTEISELIERTPTAVRKTTKRWDFGIKRDFGKGKKYPLSKILEYCPQSWIEPLKSLSGEQ